MKHIKMPARQAPGSCAAPPPEAAAQQELSSLVPSAWPQPLPPAVPPPEDLREPGDLVPESPTEDLLEQDLCGPLQHSASGSDQFTLRLSFWFCFLEAQEREGELGEMKGGIGVVQNGERRQKRVKVK